MQNWFNKGGKGSRDLLVEFPDPSMFQERLKLETSKLTCRLTAWGAYEKYAKLGQRKPWRGHVT